MRAKGLGARVIVTEVDPLKALEATMDGFRVMTGLAAARIGDFFCTVTGNISVLTKEHFLAMKDGAIVANSGHFNVEVDIAWLEKNAEKRSAREFVDEYSLKGGKRIAVLGEGRLINLAAAEGHPAAVMDVSFTLQALCVEELVANRGALAAGVLPVPAAIDREVARLKAALAEFQAIAFALADMATELEAARTFVWRAAAALDRKDTDATMLCAMAKRFGTDVGFDVANQALQLHGGYGY